MMNNKRNRGGGRMNPAAGRSDKRIYSQDRQQKSRGQTNDKNVPIEGLYKNPRLTHVMFSMVGCVVQAQVKNGIVYEGILKTTSSSGDTVLECAHMVEDNGRSRSPVSSTPSKDRILSKLIIKNTDLVTLNAPSIDLDYAVKDSFTDTGISKFNGETKDKEMRELTPWESDGGYEISLDDGDKSSSNGWDANDMFHTNAVQFNVQSSYDDSLGQYTTKLERGTSEEYRRREQEALKMAAEIERCDSYKKNIAMENGEGGDEEAAFSAVVRPGESSSHTQPTGQGGPGKYQPPFKRQPGSGGVTKGRGGYSSQTNRNMPGQHQSAPVTQVSSQSSVENINGDESSRQTIPASTAGPTVRTSPTVHEHGPPSQSEKGDHASHIPHLLDGKKPAKGRDEQIKELKAFSTNFKLDDNKDNTKDKEKDKDNSEKSSVERKDSVSEEKDSGSEKVVNVSENKEHSQHTQPAVTAVPVSVSQHEKTVSSDDRQVDGKVIQNPSTGSDSVPNPSKEPSVQVKLNPEAKEFVPGNLSFQMSVQQTAPSPHRPQTQSPVVLTQQMTQPMYPNTSQQFAMLPQHQMVLNPPAVAAAASQPPYKVQPKRAVVSVKPSLDYPQSAAVQAATGQPLLQSAGNPGYMFLQHPVMPPQPTGYQMGQVMPMPAAQAPGQRFMTPTSVQGVPSSMPHGSGMDRGNPALQASQVYMTTPNQQGPMPAHLSHFSHNNHILMSNPNSQQQQQQQQQQSSQMNAPPSGAGGHHHPAPSPVHTNPNPQNMNPGPHPPSSGTPQPPQGYANPNMPNHPPLQQSPHNPTSPQNMQSLYPYTSPGHPMQMQGSAGGQQFSSVPQHSSVPTSGTFSMQPHHSPHMQHQQYVMMPPSGQLNHPHLQTSHQFQAHPMPGKFSGSMQPHVMSQSGVQGLPGQNPGQGPHAPHQMQHFSLPVQHPGGPHVQNYQHSQ